MESSRPEPPDFDRIAGPIVRLVSSLCHAGTDGILPDWDALRGAIVGVQREAWTARGAADLRAVHERFNSLTQWESSEPYRAQVADAITALDRT
jgi:hypothetical protein